MGNFTFKNINISAANGHVTVIKTGYFKGIRSFVTEAGKNNFVKIQLIKQILTGNYYCSGRRYCKYQWCNYQLSGQCFCNINWCSLYRKRKSICCLDRPNCCKFTAGNTRRFKGNKQQQWRIFIKELWNDRCRVAG